jgi:putative endopeptidase
VFALVTLLALAGSMRAIGSVPKSGIDTSSIDHTCKACDDFYQFAEGNWVKNHPVPAAYSSYGRFTVLSDSNTDALHAILDDVSQKTYANGSIEQKVGDYYASCMDTAAIDAAGSAPIAKELGIAAELPNISGLPSTIAALDRDGVASFFSFGSEADLHDSAQTIVDVGQGGLGLPDRDYYLKDDDKTKAIRDAYVAHVTKMFALLGDAPDVAAQEASAVLKIETTLATDSLSRVALRDPAASDHRVTFAELQALTPNFDWTSYFASKKLATTNAINVDEPEFFKGVSTLFGSTPVADLRAYLRWHVVHAYASVLPESFDAENFAFYSTTLSGQKEQQPRWKRCVGATDRSLGEALGQLYVAKTFPPSAKVQALAMVQNIKATLRDDFSTLDWMTPATRAKAIEKLDAFTLKIGYPDKWRDYSTLPVVRTSYAENAIAANNFRKDDIVAQIGKPVDRARWGMTPPTVNAYYNPSENEIVFPAGILQPPFYDKDADMAVNYGGIGAVIGHESTHGFDDEGRKFDAKGDLSDLWTPEDVKQFNARAGCIVKQYDALSPLPGVNENGSLVQGEAIADLGGVTIAYKAFEKWQSTHPRLILDGYTPEQRFFLGWAQVWASNQRPEETALRAKTDVHAYDKFRVNATLANIPGFAKAWFCKLTQPMVRTEAERCQIW